MKKRGLGKLFQTVGRSDFYGPFEHLFLPGERKHDEKLLKQGLDMLPGVTSVSLSDRGCVAVDYDSTGVRQEQIRQKVQELGYQLKAED